MEVLYDQARLPQRNEDGVLDIDPETVIMIPTRTVLATSGIAGSGNRYHQMAQERLAAQSASP